MATLVVVASVLAFVGIFSLWINRQALNTDNWTDTSIRLLANRAIQTEVATFVVDQIYANVNVQAELASRLPAQLQPLAGPARAGCASWARRRRSGHSRPGRSRRLEAGEPGCAPDVAEDHRRRR